MTLSIEGVERILVIDTNVLLYDPRSIFAFQEHHIHIPMTVIEEMDRFKKDVNEIGRNARTVSRQLDELREKGSLKEGVPLPNGGRLLVDFDTHGPDLPIVWGAENNDNRIIRSALRLHLEHPGRVTLITRDTNMRLKADALGISAEDYESAHISVDEQFSGVKTAHVPSSMIDELYAEGLCPPPSGIFFPNQFVILCADDGSKKSAQARVDGRSGHLKLVPKHKEGAWGLSHRNKEQQFAMELLLDDNVQLVTLNGMAGTGKTLMALACGLRKVTDEQLYSRLLVSRPIFPMGRDIGFLPGDLEEKLNPWMKPIFDNLEFLVSMKSGGAPGKSKSKTGSGSDPGYQQLIDQKMIEVEALTYIRGRSIAKQFLIVDEAQNLTPHEIKTVLTRAGEGTKVVLTGDPNQIDNPYVDAMSNGLTYVVERFKNSPISGHITFQKGERSELAELAAKLL